MVVKCNNDECIQTAQNWVTAQFWCNPYTCLSLQPISDIFYQQSDVVQSLVIDIHNCDFHITFGAIL